MAAIRRNITRVVKDISGTRTEITKETSTPASDTEVLALATTDELYIGFKKPFTTRYFALSTPNDNAVTITVKYWDGDSWEDVEDLVDQTNGLTQSGFLSWKNLTDWKVQKLDPINDVDLYWIQITVGTNLDADFTVQAILNLFCDDDLVRPHYPELISDTRYLPANRTDFLEQYEEAKELVVKRMKKKGIIQDEADVIDINEVDVATAHAFAWILLKPIARDDEEREFAAQAYRDMEAELDQIPIDVDHDNSGIIEEDEKNARPVFIARR